MQESQASRINADAELDAIYKNLQAKKSYLNLKEQLFQRLIESKISKSEWVTQLPRLAASSQIENKLKQVIYDISNSIIKPDPIRYDTLDSINQARQFWTEFLVQNLIKVSNKLLERLSNPDTNRKNEEEHENLSIFDHRNLYAACTSTCFLRSKRSLSNPGDVKMAERITFDPVPMDQLKETYAELLYDDNNLIGDDLDEESLIIEKEKEAETLLQKGGFSEMEEFARKGVPSGVRVRFYRKYFGIDNQLKANKFHKQFVSIQETMKGHKYIIDEIINEEIWEVLNDEKYFIFDEALIKVIWTFFRDKHVQEKLAILPILPFSALDDINKIIPYCGVIPCQQFARYALPFLFTSERADDVYFLFREFYCKYFCFLNSLSSHPNSILSIIILFSAFIENYKGLCHLFEEIFYKQNPKLAIYFANNGIEPLPIALQWMMYCFIGFLDIEQLFILFDRIIGYNSLELLALLAAGIFMKKTEKIVRYKSREKVEEICMNLKNINVVECIRLALPE